MSSRLPFVGGAALALILAGVPAHSQEYGDGEHVAGRPVLFLTGGGHNALRSLSDGDNDTFDIESDFETGYNLGGGLGVQLSPGVALRATYNFARSQGEGGTFSPIAGNHFNRHYYGADFQFRTGSGGFMPYLLLGGGAVTIDPDDRDTLTTPGGASFDDSNFTKPAGKLGLGFEYQIPNSGFGLFAEGTGWVYEWDRYGFNRTQVDTNWGAGLTYRWGY